MAAPQYQASFVIKNRKIEIAIHSKLKVKISSETPSRHARLSVQWISKSPINESSLKDASFGWLLTKLGSQVFFPIVKPTRIKFTITRRWSVRQATSKSRSQVPQASKFIARRMLRLLLLTSVWTINFRWKKIRINDERTFGDTSRHARKAIFHVEFSSLDKARILSFKRWTSLFVICSVASSILSCPT